jgi:hypothetical protein
LRKDRNFGAFHFPGDFPESPNVLREEIDVHRCSRKPASLHNSALGVHFFRIIMEHVSAIALYAIALYANHSLIEAVFCRLYVCVRLYVCHLYVYRRANTQIALFVFIWNYSAQVNSRTSETRTGGRCKNYSLFLARIWAVREPQLEAKI